MNEHNKATISIFFPVPSIKKLSPFTPEERLEMIKKYKVDKLKRCEKIFSKGILETIGKSKNPSGIIIKKNKSNLSLIQKYKWMKNHSFSDESYEETETYLFFGIATFVVQIEGKKKGKQTVETRFLLVEANSKKEAKSKLKKEFKKYQKPYLNDKGRMVQWTYANDLEIYNTFLEKSDLKTVKEGMEIFSFLDSRKITKQTVWEG